MKLTLPKGRMFSMYYKILRNYMNGPYCALVCLQLVLWMVLLGSHMEFWCSLRLPAARAHHHHIRTQAAAPELAAMWHCSWAWRCLWARGMHVPHDSSDVLRGINTPLCSVDITSFLVGINIRDDTYSSQWGLFIWCQQMLAQAFASSFSNDMWFHLSSVNCVNLE